VITAAGPDEIASWDEHARHGLFTKHLLEALYGAADGAGYGDGDGEVTVAEVKAYLDSEMTYQARRRYGREQTATVLGDVGRVLATYTFGGSPPEEKTPQQAESEIDELASIVRSRELVPAQSLARECDALAASPLDDERISTGVEYEQLNSSAAIPACRRAVEANPNNARLEFQLGRALHKGEMYDEAFEWVIPGQV
jgi:thioredoxin-like negative regulator of GroEL